MDNDCKKILLIDLDDNRRASRVKLLQASGYDVDLRCDYVAAESLDDEGIYDIVIIALHDIPDRTLEYSDHLAKNNPDLPMLLLTDHGVFVPRGTLSRNLQAGNPIELMKAIASMLVGSIHIREVPVG
jgi:DNA-binding NtrC family response regulator